MNFNDENYTHQKRLWNRNDTKADDIILSYTSSHPIAIHQYHHCQPSVKDRKDKETQHKNTEATASMILENEVNHPSILQQQQKEQQQKKQKEKQKRQHSYSYEATGPVANARLSPLLPSDWVDVTTSSTTTTISDTTTTTPTTVSIPDFLWENTPRRDTKDYRDHVKVYSHLPNGSSILDSKWVLGRLLSHNNSSTVPTTTVTTTTTNGKEYDNDNDSSSSSSSLYDPLLLATCETHCFTGLDGFEEFASRMDLLKARKTTTTTGDDENENNDDDNNNKNGVDDDNSNDDDDDEQSTSLHHNHRLSLPDILNDDPVLFSSSSSSSSIHTIPPSPNLWVVKDVASNGAGGVWVVGIENASSFVRSATSPLYPQHRYVAQKYVWPPLLMDGKKFHVRAYVTITCDGGAYLHRRAFLHVANETFTIDYEYDDDDTGRTNNTSISTTTNSTNHQKIVIGNNNNNNEMGDRNNNSNKNNNNKKKRWQQSNHRFDDCVHITNCCANSHDGNKFAGEILADFGLNGRRRRRRQQQQQHLQSTTSNNNKEEKDEVVVVDGQRVIPLGEFLPSVKATIIELVQKTFPYMEGGQRNHGFEYCGVDFILSYKDVTMMMMKKKDDENVDEQADSCGGNNNSNDDKDDCTTSSSSSILPVAYLLEVNAPPSQDTATGLPHAENLHNEVLRDWMNYWVVPHVTRDDDNKGRSNSSSSNTNNPPSLGGWMSVLPPKESSSSGSEDVAKVVGDEEKANIVTDDEEWILPSKAAILNKIRWTLCERKLQREQEAMSLKVENDASKGTNRRPAILDHRSHDDRDCEESLPLLPYEIARFARLQFPFFDSPSTSVVVDNHDVVVDTNRNCNPPPLAQTTTFFENAGGAQVPYLVIDYMCASLRYRHRSVVGSRTKLAARETALRILGGTTSGIAVLGLNSTSLLSSLAQQYVHSGLLSSADEVVLSIENHRANFDPWIAAARLVGATIKLWTPFARDEETTMPASSSVGRCQRLQDLITTKTRIVALPHASNVLGLVRPIKELSKMIKTRSGGYAHVVVDGVASAPHVCTRYDDMPHVDWYVVSMHKLFGPHVGVLLARRGRAMEQFSVASGFASDSDESVQRILESGTANIEGCAGVVGLGMYLKSLACFGDYCGKGNTIQAEGSSTTQKRRERATSGGAIECITNESLVSLQEIEMAYRLIRRAEELLVDALISELSQSPLVSILTGRPVVIDDETSRREGLLIRLPIVSFVHRDLPSSAIVKFCEEHGIVCRHGEFLCTEQMAHDLGFGGQEGVVRVSLAHYNTVEEVERLCSTLETMPGWGGNLKK